MCISMAFQDSSLHVAGQDSDFVDIFFRSSEISRSLQDARLSPIHGKQMYGDTESIQSWIDTIDRPNKPAFNLNDCDDADVFEFATHPFRTFRPHSPFFDELESNSDVSLCFDSSTWAPALLPSSYYDDSDESRSEPSLSDDAQYITIPFDSPWYRPSLPSPRPLSAHEHCTAAYAKSCSSDVRQAIAQQGLLLAVFHEELRRAVPRGDGAEYDSDWLEDVDADLVLEPLETYADLCWESAVRETSRTQRSGRPIPDVPMGFDEVLGAY